MKNLSRRHFLQSAGAAAGAGLLAPLGCTNATAPAATGAQAAGSGPFSISLAQWSLHRALFAGELDPLDFPKLAREDFGIEAVEYVNQFYKGKGTDMAYLAEMKSRAADQGVKNLLIMVDGEGNLGEPEATARRKVVENHYKWVDAAAYLGCHSVRVNAGGPGDREELAANVTDGLDKLSAYAAQAGLNVIVENHGGLSSDAAWLAGIMKEVGRPNCGTLPDFGNFCIRRETDTNGGRICVEEYDRYQGVAELMPFAKAVSAKSHDFNAAGEEVHTDYHRMMKIVLAAGYSGYVGIEYEGSAEDEYTGIRKTRDLLLRIRNRLTA